MEILQNHLFWGTHSCETDGWTAKDLTTIATWLNEGYLVLEETNGSDDIESIVDTDVTCIPKTTGQVHGSHVRLFPILGVESSKLTIVLLKAMVT